MERKAEEKGRKGRDETEGRMGREEEEKCRGAVRNLDSGECHGGV